MSRRLILKSTWSSTIPSGNLDTCGGTQKRASKRLDFIRSGNWSDKASLPIASREVSNARPRSTSILKSPLAFSFNCELISSSLYVVERREVVRFGRCWKRQMARTSSAYLFFFLRIARFHHTVSLECYKGCNLVSEIGHLSTLCVSFVFLHVHLLTVA